MRLLCGNERSDNFRLSKAETFFIYKNTYERSLSSSGKLNNIVTYLNAILSCNEANWVLDLKLFVVTWRMPCFELIIDFSYLFSIMKY